MCDELKIENFLVFAGYIESGAVLRAAISAGTCDPRSVETDEEIIAAFDVVLSLANSRRASADDLVSLFHMVRPFTLGNGRCSRALWMWRMARGSVEERNRVRFGPPSDAWSAAPWRAMHS